MSQAAIIEILKNCKSPAGGYYALNQMDICRRINGVKDRSFCHKTGFVRPNLTAGSFSKSRGCKYLKREQYPCTLSNNQVKRRLNKLVESGILKQYRARSLDHKKSKIAVMVSRDLYTFYVISSGET